MAGFTAGDHYAAQSTYSTGARQPAWPAREDQMTVFRDIAGWREELEELLNGPAFSAMYPPNRLPKDEPRVPLSAILDFTETLLLNAETREALTIFYKWYEDHPLGDRTHYDIRELNNDPTFPHDKSDLLHRDFPRWYILKTGFGPRKDVYHTGCSLASEILQGNIPNVRSEQARQYLKESTNEYSVDHNK